LLQATTGRGARAAPRTTCWRTSDICSSPATSRRCSAWYAGRTLWRPRLERPLHRGRARPA